MLKPLPADETTASTAKKAVRSRRASVEALTDGDAPKKNGKKGPRVRRASVEVGLGQPQEVSVACPCSPGGQGGVRSSYHGAVSGRVMMSQRTNSHPPPRRRGCRCVLLWFASSRVSV